MQIGKLSGRRNPLYTGGAITKTFLLFLFIVSGLVGRQGLSQDFETGCLKLAVVKFLGVHIFKGDHNILRFQP